VSGAHVDNGPAYRKPLPKVTALNEPFWAAARRHELHLQRCNSCESWIYPISPVCQTCWSEDWTWRPTSGKGVVTSWVTYHKAFEASFREDLPYTVLQVDLEEGPRLISNFIDPMTKPGYLMPVTVAFDDVTEEVSLIKFSPSPMIKSR
jgi:uncharacterized OB-fold protein